ncbi:MAG: hypothetical protein IKC02_00585 [Oscillospiraceae bacterium]|nr:hypothetical protein [Oscillospiraceae bacterium]
MMDKNITALLELGRAAVIAIDNVRIIHMNSSAIALFGGNHTGKSPVGLLPDHLIFGSSECFTSAATLNGHSCCAQVKVIEGIRYISLEEEKPAEASSGILSKALLSDMLSTLFNIGLAIDRVGNLVQPKTRQQTEYLAILNHNYYSLRHALSNLSTSISIREGTLPFHFSVIDLAQICSDIVSTVSVMCARNGISIEFASRHGEILAYADEEKIERVILNLISNSIAHTAEGGKITLGLEKSGDTAYISVNDTGCGIASHNMSRLFTAYEREINLSSPESFKGGLGLGVARALADGHGGALIIESREGEGCSVRFILPLNTRKITMFESPAINYVNSGMSLILTELSGVLDSDCYSEKYLD